MNTLNNAIYTDFDPDSSEYTWLNLYQKLYTTDQFDLWKEFEFNNLSHVGNRLIAYRHEGQIYPQFNNYKLFSFGGDTLFNFYGGKREVQYNRFKNLLKYDYSGADKQPYLNKLKEYKENMHHSFENFALLLRSGNMNGFKKRGILNKESGKYEFLDRFDSYIFLLNDFYKANGNKYDHPIIKYAHPNSKKALFEYLCIFDCIYDYCNKVYLIDKHDPIIKSLISQGELPINTGQRVIEYINLADKFWKIRREKFTELKIAFDYQ